MTEKPCPCRTVNAKYFGQTTKTAEERFKEHKISRYFIGNAIRAQGADMFVIVILKEGSGKAELDYWEKRFIKYRDTKSPNGYNLTEGGEGLTGIQHSLKTCSKISATQRKETPFKNLIKEIDRCQLTYTVLFKAYEFAATNTFLQNAWQKEIY